MLKKKGSVYKMNRNKNNLIFITDKVYLITSKIGTN